MRAVLLLLAAAISVSAQSRMTVKVDPRIELMAVVQVLAELAKSGYNFNAPADTMVCLSAPPELVLQGAPERCNAARAGGSESLHAWLVQLRAFAAESDFMSFFRAHAGFYSMVEEAARKNITRDYAADLEAYYGVRQAS